jgi:hypothetical protein
MTDVRKALWNAYKKEEESEDGIYGKSSEAYCELRYPTYWDCEVIEEFLEPCGIMIYSYALGPSRSHYIMKGPVDRQVNYYTWEAPDIYKKAVEVINSWIE